MGLAVTPSKTRLPHPLHVEEGEGGCACLGFTMRPYPTQSQRGDKTLIQPSREAMARHQRQLGAVVRRQRMDPQARLMEAWTPMLRGWSHDCATIWSHET